MNAKLQHSFEEAQSQLSALRREGPSVRVQRERFDVYRRIIHLLEDGVAGIGGGRRRSCFGAGRWRGLVEEAFRGLGGAPEPCLTSLRDYDSQAYGPYLGVSDEGKAAHHFRDAILRSPKAVVLGPQPPEVIGAALDAERLAAVGEVAVGPTEYRDIWLACQGTMLMTTNVGTRLNLRYYAVRPTLSIAKEPFKKMEARAIAQFPGLFAPFWRTPDGIPRPVTVFASFEKGISYDDRLSLLRKLHRSVRSGAFCDPKVHKFGLLANVGFGADGVRAARRHMGMAHAAGLEDVAIRGYVTRDADDQISLPGLLNYFDVPSVRALMSTKQKKGIVLTPKNLVDPNTVARQVWAPLEVARRMGLALGKYGLFPLTLEETDAVTQLIQSWFKEWSAAPVCYVDLPIVSQKEIYTEKELEEGMKRWLEVVAKNGIRVVLFDTAKKGEKRRLMKDRSDDSVGFLDAAQLQNIDQYASSLGIKALWAGGISLRQTFVLGKLKVFGLYVTSAAAAQRPLRDSAAADPSLAVEKRITFAGVRNAKLLLEAGFLVSRYYESGRDSHAQMLEQTALKLIAEAEQRPQVDSPTRRKLHILALDGWAEHFKAIGRLPRNQKAISP